MIRQVRWELKCSPLQYDCPQVTKEESEEMKKTIVSITCSSLLLKITTICRCKFLSYTFQNYTTAMRIFKSWTLQMLLNLMPFLFPLYTFYSFINIFNISTLHTNQLLFLQFAKKMKNSKHLQNFNLAH